MTDKDKLELLEEMLDMDEGSLSEDAKLSDIEEWDSLAVISLIALMDDRFGRMLSHSDIKKFTAVRDILDCMN